MCSTSQTLYKATFVESINFTILTLLCVYIHKVLPPLLLLLDIIEMMEVHLPKDISVYNRHTWVRVLLELIPRINQHNLKECLETFFLYFLLLILHALVAIVIHCIPSHRFRISFFFYFVLFVNFNAYKSLPWCIST